MQTIFIQGALHLGGLHFIYSQSNSVVECVRLNLSFCCLVRWLYLKHTTHHLTSCIIECSHLEKTHLDTVELSVPKLSAIYMHTNGLSPHKAPVSEASN